MRKPDWLDVILACILGMAIASFVWATLIDAHKNNELADENLNLSGAEWMCLEWENVSKTFCVRNVVSYLTYPDGRTVLIGNETFDDSACVETRCITEVLSR